MVNGKFDQISKKSQNIMTMMKVLCRKGGNCQYLDGIKGGNCQYLDGMIEFISFRSCETVKWRSYQTIYQTLRRQYL